MKDNNIKPSKLGEIRVVVARRKGEDRYSSVFIWSSDQCLLRAKTVAEREKENEAAPPRYDTHQFDKFQTKKELVQFYEYNEESRTRATGIFVGLFRGQREVEARRECADWILNTPLLREFIRRQEDKNQARAAAVLFLFYRCNQTDGYIAELLEDSEEAIRKFRQRLVIQANAWFRKPKKEAA